MSPVITPVLEDDVALVQRAAGGDARAFDALMRRHGAAIRRLALRITRNEADADDVLQETTLRVWQHLHTLDDPTRAQAWILRIAAREAFRLLASRRPAHELTEGSALVAGADRHVDRLDLQDALQVVLDSLPRQQARVWLLREFGGYTYREIAEQIGSTDSTVRGSLAAARKRIQHAIDPICPTARIAAPLRVLERSVALVGRPVAAESSTHPAPALLTAKRSRTATVPDEC